MSLKRTKLDKVFSDLIRERNDWTCEVCGKEFPERKGAGLHCSHYFGRRGASTRHHGSNCFAHCFGCHNKLGESPHEFKAWVEKTLGETCYDDLVRRARGVVKRTPGEREEMYVHFKAQLEYMKKRRRDGHVGYIDFVEWD